MSRRRWTLVALSFCAAIAVSLAMVWRGWKHDGSMPALPWHVHLFACLVFALETITRATKVQWGAKALRIPLRWTTALRVSLGGDFGASRVPRSRCTQSDRGPHRLGGGRSAPGRRECACRGGTGRLGTCRRETAPC